MGTTDMDKICGTCGQNNINCPGHFGHIELSKTSISSLSISINCTQGVEMCLSSMFKTTC